ncbi:transcription initiation protein [Nakamurella flava]|uniref:Transcription initiation protein n=1 Tax=Nakamurella flava TaxID=2576308 RepID=A0A4U6QJ62_9ACTN|nr:YciI family protein [Nakamurella flava]TKV60311.1 transcription initiation protein [Nakamurella flava]
MTKFLISFPAAAMQIPADELPAVSDATRAVVRDAKAAGVWVFGGALDETVPPVLVGADRAVTEGSYPQTATLDGGYCILELPDRDAALHWAARFAASCRCAQELRAFHFDPES